jgi:hypothetical protein
MFTMRAPRWRVLLLALVGCLVAATVGGVVIGTATAASPTTPVKMVLTSVTSDVSAPSGTPSGAVPYVLVEAGAFSDLQARFTVHVSFYDASNAPAAFSNDTTLAITSNRGTLSPSTYVVPKGAVSADIPTSLGVAANQVSVTVKVASGKSKGLGTTSSDGSAGFVFIDGTQIPDQRFDVVSELHSPVTVGPNGTSSIGGDDDSCTNATKTNPVCGILILPFGSSSQVVLSLGACDATYAACGSSKGAVVQALANLSDPGYSPASPATLIVKCDKSLCGGGAIQNVHLEFSLGGNTPLGPAGACPAKNTVGQGQSACVDYVQSKRDGSGDTHLYLLFDQDMRTSVG